MAAHSAAFVGNLLRHVRPLAAVTSFAAVVPQPQVPAAQAGSPGPAAPPQPHPHHTVLVGKYDLGVSQQHHSRTENATVSFIQQCGSG